MVLPGDQMNIVHNGDSLSMRVATGEVITVYANADCKPTSAISRRNPREPQIISYYLINYKCHLSDLKKLGKSPITALRVFFGGQAATMEDIKEKYASKIMDAAYCIRH